MGDAMSERFPSRFHWMVLLTLALSLPTRAEEMVTIPKSRLEELERKEKELDALKGDLGKARDEQRRLERDKNEAEAARVKAEADRVRAETERAKAESENERLARAKDVAEVALARSESVIAHDTPAITSLPALKRGEVVDAIDLMNHYRTDASVAEQRYGKKRLRVRGVVAGFEKTPFMSFYTIMLQTTEQSRKVICHVDPPPEFKATYPAQHGDALVGVTKSDARLTLLRVGQTAEIEANCKGLKDHSVLLTGGKLVLAE
jgi:hypothetical protein